MSKQPYPKEGDEWEVRMPGKRMKRKIVRHVGPLHGGIIYINWERKNKGRYTGIFLPNLRKYGKRISTKAERETRFLNQINTQRARMGKQPIKSLK